MLVPLTAAGWPFSNQLPLKLPDTPDCGSTSLSFAPYQLLFWKFAFVPPWNITPYGALLMLLFVIVIESAELMCRLQCVESVSPGPAPICEYVMLIAPPVITM